MTDGWTDGRSGAIRTDVCGATVFGGPGLLIDRVAAAC
jgi:hypothetical protein